MKISSNIGKLFLAFLIFGTTMSSCKDKEAATETDTTEITTETSMDTVPPVPTEEMPATTDTTAAATGTAPAP